MTPGNECDITRGRSYATAVAIGSCRRQLAVSSWQLAVAVGGWELMVIGWQLAGFARRSRVVAHGVARGRKRGRARIRLDHGPADDPVYYPARAGLVRDLARSPPLQRDRRGAALKIHNLERGEGLQHFLTTRQPAVSDAGGLFAWCPMSLVTSA